MSSRQTIGSSGSPSREKSVGRQLSGSRNLKRRPTRDFFKAPLGQGLRHSIGFQLPQLLVGDEDVTPLRLNPAVYEGGKERQISIHDTSAKESFILAPQSLGRVDSQRFHATLLQQKQQGAGSQSYRRTSFLASDVGLEGWANMSGYSERSDFSLKTAGEEERETKSFLEKIPQNISLVLQETETVFLLDLPSCTVSRSCEEADAVDEDNKTYDYLTKGKGRNRKVLDVGVQTLPILLKARDSETNKIRYKSTATYVSTWEMYDMLRQETKIDSEEETEEDADGEEYELEVYNIHQLNEEDSLESYRLSSEDKQINRVVKSKAFFDALIVIERILGNNTFNEEQKRYKGLVDLDNLTEDKVYKYKLDLLWTYANDSTEGRCVTALAFNAHNEDMVAVAYGKYYYNDRNCEGMVMIWNIKNPQQPERHYDFPVAVTSVAFSRLNPNLLAVGFYNGHINILDVSKRETVVIRENTSTSFEPVWSVIWCQQGEEEDIMASFGDGKVCKFQIKPTQKLKCTQIMIAAAAEGKLKGITYLKKCEGKDISISRYEEARCLALHPGDPFTYFVGTSEGVVHRCSTNYYNEHMDLFKAHDGAIHTMKFSPFANKLYYTCGDDFRTRLWVDGIHDPLVTSEPSILPVLDVDWSPSHATVVASIRGSDVLVWDMQRKMYAPQSLTKNSKNVFNTVCRFTPNGRCLMVGDMSGAVRVYALEDMPIAPFFPEQLVYHSVKKLLVTKPELIKKLKKLGRLNFEKQQTSKYFT